MKITIACPERVLRNEELASEFPDWPAEKIQDKLGIVSRHVCGEGDTALELAVNAVEKILRGEDRSLIDFLLLCTQSPDYKLPTTACLLQHRLGLRKNMGAYDFNLGCSGFIYGLAQAKGLLAAGIAHRILLVTSETYTKYIHHLDRGNRSIFGDAATAMLLSADDCEIGEFILETDGAGAENLIVRNGGARHCYDQNAPLHSFSNGSSTDNDLYMNGTEIFSFAMNTIPDMVKAVLEKNHLTLDEIDYVVLHQANSFILNSLRKIIRIPAEKFVIELAEYGNTVSSSIPIALSKMLQDGRLSAGKKILLCGFGVGYSSGATVLTIR